MNFIKDRKESTSADVYMQSWLNKLVSLRLLSSESCLVAAYYTFFVQLDNVGCQHFVNFILLVSYKTDRLVNL